MENFTEKGKEYYILDEEFKICKGKNTGLLLEKKWTKESPEWFPVDLKTGKILI